MESNGEEENYEGGDDRDYPEVSENDIQNQNENNDKLNINKKIESSRDEILPKEDKVNDKQTKENSENMLSLLDYDSNMKKIILGL